LIGEKVLESDLLVNMGNEIVKTARLTGDEPTRVEGLDLLWLLWKLLRVACGV
jgi:hypothetical protein